MTLNDTIFIPTEAVGAMFPERGKIYDENQEMYTKFTWLSEPPDRSQYTAVKILLIMRSTFGNQIITSDRGSYDVVFAHGIPYECPKEVDGIPFDILYCQLLSVLKFMSLRVGLGSYPKIAGNSTSGCLGVIRHKNVLYLIMRVVFLDVYLNDSTKLNSPYKLRNISELLQSHTIKHDSLRGLIDHRELVMRFEDEVSRVSLVEVKEGPPCPEE